MSMTKLSLTKWCHWQYETVSVLGKLATACSNILGCEIGDLTGDVLMKSKVRKSHETVPFVS